MKKFRLDELDIRILKAKGKTPQEVAGELGILPMQAEARMKSIFLKLGVRTFKEARKKFEEELKN